MKISLSCAVLGTFLLIAGTRAHLYEKSGEGTRRIYGDNTEYCMQPCGLPLIKLGSDSNEFYFHTSTKKLVDDLLGLVVEKFNPFKSILKLDFPPLPEDQIIKNMKIPEKTSVNEYYIHTESKLTWMEANKYCQANALNLLSIENKEENDLILRATAGSGEVFWTSGNDIEKEGNYMWMSTGRNVTFTGGWGDGQPANSISENCVFVGQYKGSRPGWHDAPCMWKQYFICEKY